MSRTQLVTDATACLPRGTAERLGVAVVPLHVTVSGRGTVQAREITPAEVADILATSSARMSTSRPSPGEFVDAYRDVAERTGADTIVSAHLSGAVSGTVEAAELARDELAGELTVEVVDSRVLGMALGYAVCAGAEAAASGAGAADVAEVVSRHAAASRTWFYVDTLEHLRRGGRIGRAAALVGSALAIKPLLTLRDGEVHPEERVRTRAKALARLVDRAAAAVEEARAEGLEVRMAVHELGAAEAAADLAGTLQERTGLEPLVTELDPVVGVHTGPGTLGVVVAPEPR
ncbi:DegV family protein with EDD domain [Ornithinimicrobium humiphilum]|uniref:DegV family protein with EDD domain n=1 Tax=Ornithinimicrobium humiphilum TaxID=125288 RepID=A0A543KMH7_9MICO|nr:DegV family protein [Ornithinimicrobium humiphilum]TQM96290.1 DegV family protein with EDD domain [Ornithinimicrobium humiphilum]